MKILLAIIFALCLFGCSSNCVCTGDISSDSKEKGERLLAKDICEAVKEKVNGVAESRKKVTIATRTFLAPKYTEASSTTGVFFEITAPETDPLIGYGQFIYYNSPAHVSLMPAGKTLIPIRRPERRDVSFWIADFGTPIDFEAMDSFGVPCQYYDGCK
jgi:hypothetical protein